MTTRSTSYYDRVTSVSHTLLQLRLIGQVCPSPNETKSTCGCAQARSGGARQQGVTQTWLSGSSSGNENANVVLGSNLEFIYHSLFGVECTSPTDTSLLSPLSYPPLLVQGKFFGIICSFTCNANHLCHVVHAFQ